MTSLVQNEESNNNKSEATTTTKMSFCVIFCHVTNSAQLKYDFFLSLRSDIFTESCNFYSPHLICILSVCLVSAFIHINRAFFENTFIIIGFREALMHEQRTFTWMGPAVQFEIFCFILPCFSCITRET